ncbi:MAG: molybdenum cofactor guanylyltransferase, partial [Halobacteria archaeon]|nr:molybdenum cofactor guanylyltransferase [Halobacteria archaeon]
MVEKPDEVTGVVLAGGESTRFGGRGDNKAVAEYEGETFIERVVGSLTQTAPISNVVVVVRNQEQSDELARFLENTGFIYDDHDYSGPVAGIFGAVNEASAPWMFVCGCDMPFVSTSAVSWICDKGEDYDAVVPVDRCRDICHPLHALYRRDALAGVKPSLDKHGSMSMSM